MERSAHPAPRVPAGPPAAGGAQSLDRRRFLAAAGSLAGSLAGALAATRLPGAWAQPAPQGGRLPDGLFTVGVASGDPLADSVVLWTRLAPEPLDGGGMPSARRQCSGRSPPTRASGG